MSHVPLSWLFAAGSDHCQAKGWDAADVVAADLTTLGEYLRQ